MTQRFQYLLLLSIAALVAACGSTQQAAQPTAVASPASPTIAAPTPTRPTAVPTPGPREYANPVIRQDYPDPDALKVGDTYYVYATNFGSTNIQAAKSSDLVHWQMLSDALPFLPAWAQPGLTWAP